MAIQAIWEEKYQNGHTQRYPWDNVVSFVFRYAPRTVDRSEIKILEVGFGTGSNLWFAAREGFSVSGIEGSPTAVSFAINRFEEEGLEGDLRVGDFTVLPFDDGKFDLVIDRGALCCVGKSEHKKAIAEINRVLKKGGKFLYSGYSDDHTSAYSGVSGEDGLVSSISGGSLLESGDLCFFSLNEIRTFFSSNWIFLQLQKKESIELLDEKKSLHSEWSVIVEKS